MPRNTICLGLVLMAATGQVDAGKQRTLSAYDAGHLSADQTALIRAATKEEKQEQRSVAATIFIGPRGRGAVAKLLSIRRHDQAAGVDELAFGKNDEVRVPAGRYLVGASCVAPGWLLFFEIPVTALPGNQYLFECIGKLERNTRITVRAVPAVGN